MPRTGDGVARHGRQGGRHPGQTEKRDKSINSAVQKILKNYQPKKKT
jgi:hypothetical protein